jgi:hypothetical protein
MKIEIGDLVYWGTNMREIGIVLRLRERRFIGSSELGATVYWFKTESQQPVTLVENLKALHLAYSLLTKNGDGS